MKHSYSRVRLSSSVKMVLNPCCCGCSLQCGSKAVAAFVMIYWALFIALTLIPSLNAKPSYEVSQFIIAQIILDVVRIWLAIILYAGASQKNIKCCWMWIGFSAIMFILDLVYFLFLLSETSKASETKDRDDEYDEYDDYYDSHIPYIIIFWGVVGPYLLVSLYFIYVVYAFASQLRDERDQQRVNPEVDGLSEVETEVTTLPDDVDTPSSNSFTEA